MNLFAELLGGLKTYRKKLFAWQGFKEKWNLLNTEFELADGFDIQL